MKNLTAQRLIVVFGVGWLLFSFPLLALWDHEATVLGLPLFPAALLVIWVALLGVAGWIVERSDD